MNRQSRSFGRRSSILKIDVNKDDTGTFGTKTERSTRRVSFAENYQVKEFERDSPKNWQDHEYNYDTHAGVREKPKCDVITGLDELLTGTIQTHHYVDELPLLELSAESFNIFEANKTTLEVVDMETTAVLVEEDMTSQIDHDSELSKELKFDASSLLQSMKCRPSDRLKAMQLYSPKTDWQQQFSLNRLNSAAIHSTTQHASSIFCEYDKENIMLPIVNSQSNKDAMVTEDNPFLFQHPSFLKSFPLTKYSLEGTAGFQNNADDVFLEECMDETVCCGGITEHQVKARSQVIVEHTGNQDRVGFSPSNDKSNGVEEEKAILNGGVHSSRLENVLPTCGKESIYHSTVVIAKYLVSNDDTKETQYFNEILRDEKSAVKVSGNDGCGKAAILNKNNTVGRIHDASIGEFFPCETSSSECQKEVINEENFTKYFSEQNDMEETVCLQTDVFKENKLQPNIVRHETYDKIPDTKAIGETLYCKAPTNTSDATKMFVEDMEFTDVVGDSFAHCPVRGKLVNLVECLDVEYLDEKIATSDAACLLVEAQPVIGMNKNEISQIDFKNDADVSRCPITDMTFSDNGVCLEESCMDKSAVTLENENTFKTGYKRALENDDLQTSRLKLPDMLTDRKQKIALCLQTRETKLLSELIPVFAGTVESTSQNLKPKTTLDLFSDESPLSKKVKLDVEDGSIVELGSGSFGATSTLLSGLPKLTHGDMEDYDNLDISTVRIADEKMPEDIQIDLCSSSSFCEEEDNQSYNTETCNTGKGDISSRINKSLMQSFLIPKKGPLSLESFCMLTIKLPSVVPGIARCSTIYAPKMDMDNMEEVLLAQLTLGPLVNAKKKFKVMITAQTKISNERCTQLGKILEETQPEIFLDCINASPDKIKMITEQCMSLQCVCRREMDIAWKEATTCMLEEALHDLQVNGIKKAEEIGERVRLQLKIADDLLDNLDKELEEFEKKEKVHEDSHQVEDVLTREVQSLTSILTTKMTEETCLREQLTRQTLRGNEEDMEIAHLKQLINVHLMCVEWDLSAQDDDHAVFTFLNGTLELNVEFNSDSHRKQIINFSFKTLNGAGKCLEETVAMSFTLASIDTAQLEHKYTAKSHLPQLLHEVSLIVSEIQRFCKDVEAVHRDHILHFDNNIFTIDVWNRKCLMYVTIKLGFTPSHPLTFPAHVQVKVEFGNVKSSDIEAVLKDIEPGVKYFSRLVEAVSFFQQSHKC